MNIKVDLFLTFLKLGATTFGGGYAMVSHMKETIVEKKEWMTNDELLEIIAISESTPGPIAINMATYIGYKKGKVLGSILATLGVVLPSFIILFIISLFLRNFMDNKYVKYAFIGINCAVAFLILKAGIGMVIKAKKSWWQIALTFSIIALLLVLKFLNLSFSSIYLILIGGLISLLILSIPSKKQKQEVEKTKDTSLENNEPEKEETSQEKEVNE